MGVFSSIFDKRNLDLVITAVLALSLVMYDVTLEILGELLHLLLEMMHWLFEYVEMGIEHVVEHLFHTERYGSQIITFYILCTIIACIGWQLLKFLPSLYVIAKRRAIASWIQRKTELTLYWQLLDQPQKIARVATAVLVIYLASFFVI